MTESGIKFVCLYFIANNWGGSFRRDQSTAHVIKVNKSKLHHLCKVFSFNLQRQTKMFGHPILFWVQSPRTTGPVPSALARILPIQNWMFQQADVPRHTSKRKSKRNHHAKLCNLHLFVSVCCRHIFWNTKKVFPQIFLDTIWEYFIKFLAFSSGPF